MGIMGKDFTSAHFWVFEGWYPTFNFILILYKSLLQSCIFSFYILLSYIFKSY